MRSIMNRCLTLGLLLVCITCVLAQTRRKPPPKKVIPEVDNTCMACLCQASSNCDETLKCHNAGGGAYFCGPYVISWAYWHDGGRPGDKGRAHDFETCLNNRTCAEEAVRGYMRKYGQDCDNNGIIDCYDFARIHKLGYGACSDVSIRDTDYYQIFKSCIDPGNNDPYDSNYEASYNNNGGYAGEGIYAGGAAAGDYVDYGEGHIEARNAEKIN